MNRDKQGTIYVIVFIAVMIFAFKYILIPSGDKTRSDSSACITTIAVFIGIGLVTRLIMTAFYGKNGKNSNNITGPKYPINWDELRSQALRRDNYKCANCGSTEDLNVHHIVPISKGGTNNLENLKTICHECHKKIHPHLA